MYPKIDVIAIIVTIISVTVVVTVIVIIIMIIVIIIIIVFKVLLAMFSIGYLSIEVFTLIIINHITIFVDCFL